MGPGGYLFTGHDRVAIPFGVAWSPSAQVYHVLIAGLRTRLEANRSQLFWFDVGGCGIVLAMGTMAALAVLR